MLRNHKVIRALKTRYLAFFCILLCWLAAPVIKAQQLRIAAASDLQFAMNDLALRYESKTQTTITTSFGSSGNFFTQIENGAPFDLFFSADISYPKSLIEQKLAEPQTLYSYAFGRIALWALPGAHLITEATGFSALLDPRIQKIAIANPEHAPYGKAALAALEKAGIYDQVKSKLVYGENISQTSQFVQSGNAQIGIVALSLATAPAMSSGERWLIPPDMHPPLEQAAVILSASPNKKTAIAFLEFIKTAEARAVLAGYGFTIPQPPAGEHKR